MTPGDNGASTPEDDDPFGYLYADGQARGAQPPSGGYGYPNSVSRVRTVGERSYGAQQAPYGAQPSVPQQQGAYGQPNAHYQAPETLPGGAPSSRRSAPPVPGRRGPNTKGLLIGAIAVVAAVVIGIGVAMINGNTDDDSGNEAGGAPTQSQSGKPSPSSSKSAASGDLPKIDATNSAVQLSGGAAATSDVKGAQSSDGTYVTGMNQTGASITWKVDGIPESGKYSVYVGYSVPGKDGTVTLTVNGTASHGAVDLKNWRGAAAGDYEKGWTKTYNWIQLDKGTNTIKLSCEQGNQCDALIDRMWLVKGWVNSSG
ncbi:carbohydrate-binding protein [Streptomyces sp. Go40/10]|uniref:carbohydrate-binding protein n=1 Tax=Streptomyces sp. Go40/10 TaxID=2825844 RepID=UPI001E3AD4DC|nr:carbohydrate-binding protein [Streptomyces sp. Go40/10]UFR03778.1 carbohydrate-binding protein [Streptomyces sp. Go40/10]